MLHGIQRIIAILVFVLLTLGMHTNARAQQTPMTITYEQTISGSLDATDPTLEDRSAYFDKYVFQGELGKSYQITVKSDTFSVWVYLSVSEGQGDYILQAAYVVLPGDQVQFSGTLKQPGEYTIKVSSFEDVAVGPYTLTLSEGQRPGP